MAAVDVASWAAVRLRPDRVEVANMNDRGSAKMKVSTLLWTIGMQSAVAHSTETVETIVKRMRDEGHDAIVVSGDGASLDGIITESDVSLGLARHGAAVCSLPASTLMTTGGVTCALDDDLADVARLMINRRLRHLPVMARRRLIGILRIGDVLNRHLYEVRREACRMRELALAVRP